MSILNKIADFKKEFAAQKVSSQVYEIKLKGKYKKVRATSMKAINQYCKENKISDWRMVGIMSVSEMRESLNLEIVK